MENTKYPFFWKSNYGPTSIHGYSIRQRLTLVLTLVSLVFWVHRRCIGLLFHQTDEDLIMKTSKFYSLCFMEKEIWRENYLHCGWVTIDQWWKKKMFLKRNYGAAENRSGV